MSLFASSILVKYTLLDNSSSLVYQGTSSKSLRIWGAQLELTERSDEILQDYLTNYRYTRTSGQPLQNFISLFNFRYGQDNNPDTILIGGPSLTRMGNDGLENTAFFVDKAAKRGTEIITLYTTSTSIVASSSYAFTSATNLIVFSESFAGSWSINELTIDSTVNVPSPIGSYGDVKKLRENTVNGRHWISQVQATGLNYSGVLSFYARAAERSILGVEISNFVTEAIYYIYNLSSGTISVRAPAVNDYSNVSASMVSVGSGWYRCHLFWKRNAYSSATGNNPTFTVHDNLGAISYTGDNTSGLYLWGVQYGPQTPSLAALGYSPYIQTTSTALTNYPVSSSANLFVNSNAFTASPWLTGNLSISTSTAVTAPDGSSTVFLATEDNTVNQHLLYQSIGTVSVGQPFTFSAYLRANTSSALRQVSLTFHGLGYPIFDLTTGVVVSTGGFSSASISAVGNGWYRCTVQSAMPTTTGNFYIVSWYYTNPYLGNNQSGFYVWGAQLTTSIAQQSQLVTTTSAAIGFYASSGITVTTSFSIINTTSYNVLSTAYQSNFSGNLVTGASPDSVFVGQQYGTTRLSGDPQEIVKLDLKSTLGRDTATVSDDRRRIPSNPIYDAQAIMGINVANKTAKTFSYNRYTPVTGDNVYYNANDWFSEVGRSQRARIAVGGDTQQTFIDKRLDETKQIPRTPKYDALKVMGIELVSKTSSIINLAKYTPLRSSDITYYKKWDWYSEVPRSQYARLAYGIGDGSPYIYDNMLISGDHFEYSTEKHFYEALLLGYSYKPYTPSSDTVASTAFVGGWGTFMNTYGVWPNLNWTYPGNTIVSYRTFNAPTTTSYTIQGAGDDSTNIYIDGVQYLSSLTYTYNIASTPFASSAVVNLTAGPHIIKIETVNTFTGGEPNWFINPGGWAARILKYGAQTSTTTASDVLWDTRTYAAGETQYVPGRYSDSNENISLVKLHSMKRGVATTIVINNRHQSTTDAGFTIDAGKFRNKTWFQLAPLYTDYDHIVESEGAGETVHVGDYYGGVRHSNNKQETMAMLLSKARPEITIVSDTGTKLQTAYTKSLKNGVVTSTLLQSVIRTNRIVYSERLDKSIWTTTGSAVISSTVTLSSLLPYRNVSYDADQIHQLFYNKANTYTPKKWYLLTPLATRTAFTSNGINILNVTSSVGQHGLATPVTYSTYVDNYFLYGMYVKSKVGVNKVRLSVDNTNVVSGNYDLTGGSSTYDLLNNVSLPFANDLADAAIEFLQPHYADFDLSSVSVITSTNVSYANIISRGDGWYLVKIMGPIVGTANLETQLLNRQSGLADFVTVSDDYELVSNLFENFIPTDLLV